MFNVRLSYAQVNAADRRYSLHRAWPPSHSNRARSGRYLGPALGLILPSGASVGKGPAGDTSAATYQLAALEVPGLPEVGSPDYIYKLIDIFLPSNTHSSTIKLCLCYSKTVVYADTLRPCASKSGCCQEREVLQSMVHSMLFHNVPGAMHACSRQ